MRWTSLGVGVLLVASGCASYSQTERAKSQIAFGSEVARKGLWREAAFRFEQAIAKEPKNARAHNNLAVALEATGEFARALAEYKKALSSSTPTIPTSAATTRASPSSTPPTRARRGKPPVPPKGAAWIRARRSPRFSRSFCQPCRHWPASARSA